MKKLLKILAVLAALMVVLLVLGSIALRIYLPPEKAKALVLTHLSAQLKREVELGSVSVGILTGLKMSNLKISESPNFSKGTFLSSDEFSLKVALIPLLFRKIIVRQMVLKRPEVSIVRHADGKTFNFSDLTASTTSTAPASPAAPEPKKETKESMPFLLLVSYAEIQKGALHFVDHSPAQQTMDVAPFELKLKNVSLTAPFTVQTSFRVKSRGSEMAISVAGQANLLSGTFTIKQGTLASRESKILLSGDLSRLKTPEPAVDIKIDIPRLIVGDFAPFVTLPASLHVTKPLKGALSLKGDQKSMELASQLALGSIQLGAHGQVKNITAKQPSVNFHAETNSFPIEEILQIMPTAVPQGVLIRGNTRLSAELSGTLAHSQFTAKWIGTELTVSEGDTFTKPGGTPLEVSIIGEVPSLEPMIIMIRNMTVQLASNQLIGSGSYETRGRQGIVNFDAKARKWAVQDLAPLSPLLAANHPTGTLSFDAHASGPASALQTSIQSSAEVAFATIKQENYEGQNLQLKWNLTDITPDLSKVSGTANLKQGAGKILNVEKLAASSRVGKIALAPLAILAQLQRRGVLKEINLPSLQTVSFESLTGDYVLRSGIVDSKTFELSGRDLNVQNHGTVGLAGSQPLHMSVIMKLAAGTVGGTLGSIMNDESGRPTINFAITGTVPAPVVKLDVQEIRKKALQQAGQEIMKNKDVQNAVDDLQKSLKGLFH